ncbi:hypothetical protein [Serratia marcescens]|uniref:hypothetical protein n=1 Tax=Serratia marcescens TaxID=615 RepID=UPI0018D91DB6|nr:hypothetical protein [Serratia marcescens]
MKKFLKWVLIIFVVLIVIGYISGKDKQTTSTTALSSSTTTEKPKKERVEDSYPDQEKRFIQIVEQAISGSKASANDMQKGGVKADRTDALCGLLKNKSVKDWVGKVDTVDSNSDGKGVLTIQLTRDISVKTWNNALSDISDNTLLTPRTPIFNAASNLKKGDYVVFSGRFIADNESCLRESSMGLSGGLEEPEFIFKFSEIAPK